MLVSTVASAGTQSLDSPGSPLAGGLNVTTTRPLTPAAPSWMCAKIGVSML